MHESSHVSRGHPETVGRERDIVVIRFLELQRSLDYYESHFDETAISELYMAPAGMRANLLAAELGASTGLRISMFNIHDLIDVSFSAEIPDGWLPCMAIGAALRARKG
jgi:hypothetical protein